MKNPSFNIPVKKILQWVLKICLSFAALYLVYKKTDHRLLWALWKEMDAGWLLPALVLFNISKIFSSHRLTGLLHNIGIEVSYRQNLRLYYKGMFYNLFLPGGIGGDVYKAYMLNKNNEVPLKKIAGTILYDRVSGLIMLGWMAAGLAMSVIVPYTWIFLAGFILIIPAGYLCTLVFFRSHKKNFVSSQVYSFMVQLAQVLAVICLLKALQIRFIMYTKYLLLFLVSSVAAVIPFTVGGAGARELVFLYGKKLLDVSPETGVAIGLLFFMLTAVSSFAGIFIRWKKDME